LALHRQAAEAWTEFGHVFESAHAHAGVGRCALAAGDDGSGELLQARWLFAELGATPHVAAADELLGGSAAAAGS